MFVRPSITCNGSYFKIILSIFGIRDNHIFADERKNNEPQLPMVHSVKWTQNSFALRLYLCKCWMCWNSCWFFFASKISVFHLVKRIVSKPVGFDKLMHSLPIRCSLSPNEISIFLKTTRNKSNSRFWDLFQVFKNDEFRVRESHFDLSAFRCICIPWPTQ